MKCFVYKCLYYHPEDEYGLPDYPGIEVALFHNREDAEKYQEDFESNKYRCPYDTYTVYEGEIVEEEIL